MTEDPLAPLRARFRARALAEADALEDGLLAGDRERVEGLVHGLAGTAGIFGYSEIGRMAQEIDARLAAGASVPEPLVRGLITCVRRDCGAYS